MTEQEIEKYVAEQLKAGADPKVLKLALESEGIDPQVIDNCIMEAKALNSNVSLSIAGPKPVIEPKKETENEEEAPKAPEPEIEQGTDLEKIGKQLLKVSKTKVNLPGWLEKSLGIFGNKFFLIGIGALIILAGMGIYAAVAFRQTPEKIQAKFMEQLKTVKATAFDINVDAQAEKTFGLADELNLTGLKIKLKGATDNQEAANPKIQSTFSATAQGFYITGEFRLVDRFAYIKLDQLPMYEEFSGKWIRLSDKPLDMSKYQASSGLSLFKSSDLTLTKLPDENVGGTEAYHIRYEVNPIVLRTILDNAINSYNKDKKNPPKSRPKCSNLACELGVEYKLSTEMAKYFALTPGEIWIGKKNYYQLKNIQGMDFLNDGKKVGSLTITGNWSDHNKPAKIEAPYPFEDLSGVLKGLVKQ